MSTPTALRGHATGEMRLVSPLPTGPPVLLPLAGSLPEWGPRSQLWQSLIQVCVCARIYVYVLQWLWFCVHVEMWMCGVCCCVVTAFSPHCLHPPPVSLSPVVQYSLFLALKRLHGADEEAATALYHHWSVPHTDVCVSPSGGLTLSSLSLPPPPPPPLSV